MRYSLMDALKRNSALIIVILILSALTAIGISFDLPHTFVVDENHYVNRAVSFGSGDLNPRWFHKPGLMYYLLFSEYGAMYLLGRLSGTFNSVDDFALYYFTDPTLFYLVGRITILLFTAGMALLTFFVAKRFWGQAAGIAAVVILFCTPVINEHAIYITTDIPAATFMLAAFFFCLKTADSDRISGYLGAGAFAGLCMATKMYGILIFFPLLAAHLLRHINNRERFSFGRSAGRLFLSFAAFLLFFFLASPFSFLDAQGRKDNLYGPFLKLASLIQQGDAVLPHEAEVIKAKTGGAADFRAAALHCWETLADPQGAGPVLAYAGLVGLILILLSRFRSSFLLWSFPVFFFLVVAVAEKDFVDPRHLALLYPFLALWAAGLLQTMAAALTPRVKAAYHDLGLAVLVLLLVLSPFLTIIRFKTSLFKPDTRIAAAGWIKANIPSNSRILLDEEGPPLPMNSESIRELYDRARELKPGPFTTHVGKQYGYMLQVAPPESYYITQIRHPWWKESLEQEGEFMLSAARDVDMGNPVKLMGVESLQQYCRRGFQYAVVGRYTRYMGESGRKNFPSYHRFFTDLDQKAELLKTIAPGAETPRGPTILIYRLRCDAEIGGNPYLFDSHKR